MNYLTWDVGVVAVFALFLAYCLIIKKSKALSALVSLYVAYCMANFWGERVAQFFGGDRVFLNQIWIKANSSTFSAQVFLLILVTVLLTAFMKIEAKRSHFSTAEVVVYVFFATALLTVFLLGFMTPQMRDSVIHGSKIVPYIYAYREWVLGLPVLAVILFGIYGNEDY